MTSGWGKTGARRRRRMEGSPLDNRRRRVIAFALEPAIYDRSRQREPLREAIARSRTVSGLINAGRRVGNNIQRVHPLPSAPATSIRGCARVNGGASSLR